MAAGWTPERRARQAELIRSWRPWEQSTGPRTEQGKERSRNNRYRGAKRARVREMMRELRTVMAEHRALLGQLKVLAQRRAREEGDEVH